MSESGGCAFECIRHVTEALCSLANVLHAAVDDKDRDATPKDLHSFVLTRIPRTCTSPLPDPIIILFCSTIIHCPLFFSKQAKKNNAIVLYPFTDSITGPDCLRLFQPGTKVTFEYKDISHFRRSARWLSQSVISVPNGNEMPFYEQCDSLVSLCSYESIHYTRYSSHACFFCLGLQWFYLGHRRSTVCSNQGHWESLADCQGTIHAGSCSSHKFTIEVSHL